jgi:hypothetical protein
MTDHVAEMARRAELVPIFAYLLAHIITDAERVRLRRLIADYAPDDPPPELVDGCLDMPLFDPRRDWPSELRPIVESWGDHGERIERQRFREMARQEKAERKQIEREQRRAQKRADKVVQGAAGNHGASGQGAVGAVRYHRETALRAPQSATAL